MSIVGVTPTLPKTVNSLSVDESPKNAAPRPLDFKLRVAATLVLVKVRVCVEDCEKVSIANTSIK